jgi:hypothetical protein
MKSIEFKFKVLKMILNSNFPQTNRYLKFKTIKLKSSATNCAINFIIRPISFDMETVFSFSAKIST